VRGSFGATINDLRAWSPAPILMVVKPLSLFKHKDATIPCTCHFQPPCPYTTDNTSPVPWESPCPSRRSRMTTTPCPLGRSESVDYVWLLYKNNTSAGWHDVHLPGGWHLNARRMPVPREARARGDEIRRCGHVGHFQAKRVGRASK
jgi:hypothetical protein